MTTQTQPKPEPPKKVIALVGKNNTTYFNPEWPLAPCPNCNGRKCVLCSRLGVYRE